MGHESAGTKSEPGSSSSHTESTEDAPGVADRWTNNISYRQLVVSSCVGIIHMWWHPYLYDLRKLLPFLFLYNLFSIIISYPMLYLELAIGVVTKKSVLNCWDMCPMIRGVGVTMLMISGFLALALSVVGAYSLAFLVHSFHSFLPWLHCAASVPVSCAARHRPLTNGSETPAQSFFFNYVLELQREGLSSGLGNVVTELTIYYAIVWLLIYFIAFKKIYSYSKLVFLKDVLTAFMLWCSVNGVLRLEGAGKMVSLSDWKVLYDPQLWREALEYAMVETTVSQGSLIMLGAYCPKQKHKLSKTVFVAFFVSKLCTMASALSLGAVHGALINDYGNATTIYNGSATAFILWADYVARIPGSQFWSMIFFFTIFLLSLTSAALLFLTILSTFTGPLVRKMTWAFLILFCVLYALIGVLTLCTQAGLYVLNFLMFWPVSKPRLLIGAIVTFITSFVYGQTLFCEDVYFAVGEYPPIFIRICWAITPGLLLGSFMLDFFLPTSGLSVLGWWIIGAMITPICVTALLYLIFKCRVRNIVKDT